jgi:hypothetical protein
MATHARRVALLALAILVLVVLGAGVAAPAAARQGENRAGLVVQFSGEDTRTYCVPFEGDSISGLDLLLKAGLDIKVEVYGAMGGQVCKIDATGCDYPGQPCACQSYGPGGVYWSYHHLRDGTWRTSIMGASGYTVHPGDVEGWAWSTGTPPTQPYTFEQRCQAAEPPTATATSTHPPQPTITPVPPTPTTIPPTATPIPQATATVAPTQPTSTATSQPEPPTATSTPEPMPTGTPTPIPTSTAARQPPTATVAPTDRTTATPETLTPTPTAVAPAPSGEDAARYVGLVVGATVLGGLAVWGGLRLARGRQRSDGDVG